MLYWVVFVLCCCVVVLLCCCVVGLLGCWVVLKGDHSNEHTRGVAVVVRSVVGIICILCAVLVVMVS